MLNQTKSLDLINLPYRPYQLGETVPELVQQLHSFQPVRCSGDQRELARHALTALKNRKPEEIVNHAKKLANDVSGAVD